jgi:hypothetical protein
MTKLTSEMNSAGQNTSKNTVIKFFPRHFKVAKIFRQKNNKFACLIMVQDGFNGHHCPIGNLVVLALLANSPCCSIT